VLVYLGVRLVVDSVLVDVDLFCGPSVDKLIGGRIVVRRDGVEVVDNKGPRVDILICDVVVPLVDPVVDSRSVVMNARDVVDDDGLRVVDVLVSDVVEAGRIVVRIPSEVVDIDVVVLVVVETELGRRVDKRFGRVDVSCRVVVVVVVVVLGGGGVVVLLLLLPADTLLVDLSPGAVVVVGSCCPSVGMRVGMTVGMISVGIPVGIALKISVGIRLGNGD
jgi:hypothetical protein